MVEFRTDSNPFGVSVGSVVAGLRSLVRAPEEAMSFSCPNCPDRLWGPFQPLVLWVPVGFPVVKTFGA